MIARLIYPIEMVGVGRSEECGCPEEQWLVGVIDLTIHTDPDGSVHAFMDGGDEGQADTSLHGFASLDAARPTVFDWAASILSGHQLF